MPPQRANTAPMQVMARSHKAEARPKSLDDGHAQRRHARTNSDLPSNTNTPRWMPSTPEPASDTTTSSTPSETYNTNANFSTPSPIQSAMPRQDLSSAFAFPQQLTNFNNNVPDLMPIMFPSDDPFAYPTQPMSTLEDGHFRDGGTGPFTFNQQPAMPPTTNGMGLSNPPLDNFANLSLFTNANSTPTGMSPVMASRFANQQQQQQQARSRLQSPGSHVSTPGEQINSPDLVSIPNQNFMWQGYNIQPQNFTGDPSLQPQHQQHQIPAANGLPNMGAGMDENTTAGMGIDLGIPLDDLFGSNEASRVGGNYGNDEWLQWMNVGG